MTAKHPKTRPAPLREQITAYLTRTAEATAKDIATHTSEADFPSRVLNELNKMRTDALVECEKRKGKGNEYWYWLVANASTNAAQNGVQPQPEVGKNTGSTGSGVATHSAEAVAVQEPAPTPAAPPSAGSVAADDRYLISVIADIRAAVGDPKGRIMLGELAAHIETTMQEHVANRTRLAVEVTELRDQLANAQALATKLQTLLDSAGHEREALRAEIERHREQGSEAGDVLEPASGYVVLACKRKPRRINRPEAAREAALSAIRGGAQRADVFALVRIGTARRGAEWKDAQ